MVLQIEIIAQKLPPNQTINFILIFTMKMWKIAVYN
jgi:hypothetical protein